MAELADALDLGSSAARRMGSSPFIRTRIYGLLKGSLRCWHCQEEELCSSFCYIFRKEVFLLRWAKVSIKSRKSEADVVATLFDDIGAGGVEIDDPTLSPADWAIVDWAVPPEGKQGAAEDDPVVTVTSYLADDAELTGRIEKLKEDLVKFAKRSGTAYKADDVLTEIVDDKDWVDNWKKYFHTVKIGKKIVIQPAWETYTKKDNDIVIKLDPGAAFGTGTHATTALCIQALQDILRPGMRVFDVGTGSGVLAVTAAKLGAGEVVAMDYDAVAVRTVRENAERNQVENIVKTGKSNLLANFTGRADVIVANIIADLDIRLFEKAADYLEEGGKVLVSGIITERTADVCMAAREKGFKLLRLYGAKGWAAALFTREHL